MELKINKPYLNGKRLVSKIEYENEKYDLFFEVNEEYKNFLNVETANAFLIALLPFAIKHEYNIIIDGFISSKLYYQLTTYLIPLLCNEFNKKEIKIECKLTDISYKSTGVGASISCGVDSFYTLLKHCNCQDKTYNITHLTFFNAGSNGQYGGDKARELYNKRLKNITKFCKENNFKLITIDSNMNELIMMNHEKRHTFTTLACVYALEKLFNKYYFASGLGFNGSHIDESDTAYYDILNVHCLSNENISFYCSGLETTRIEKVKYISNYKMTYDWLNVCVSDSSDNCGICNKCIRTMAELDSINKINLYKNVFDLKYFYKNRSKIYAQILTNNIDKIQHDFCKEILIECKKNKIKIPISSYIIFAISFKKNIKNIIKRILPNKTLAKIKNIKSRNKINDGWMD